MLTELLIEPRHARLTKLNNKFYNTRKSRINLSIMFYEGDNLKMVDTSYTAELG